MSKILELLKIVCRRHYHQFSVFSHWEIIIIIIIILFLERHVAVKFFLWFFWASQAKLIFIILEKQQKVCCWKTFQTKTNYLLGCVRKYEFVISEWTGLLNFKQKVGLLVSPQIPNFRSDLWQYICYMYDQNYQRFSDPNPPPPITHTPNWDNCLCPS